MASFRYTSLNRSNGSAAGVIDAPDRSAAVRMLLSKGITPGSLESVGGEPSARADRTPKPGTGSAGGAGKDGAAGATVVGASLGVSAPGSGVKSTANATADTEMAGAGVARAAKRSMSLSDTAAFIRELATALQAGLPIVPALRTLAKSGRSEGQRAMLMHLITEVESGKTLSSACASWGKPFGELIINLVKAGEVSGRLGEVLHQAADLLERELHLRRAVMSATLYPAILTFLVSVAIVIVTTVIVPKILEPLKGQNITLPLPTRVVQGFANFMGAYWWAIGAVIVVALIAWQRARATPGPRLAIDRMLVRLPLMGALVRDAAVARFTRTLGTLVKAGLPVLTALRLTGATMTNHALRGAVMGVCDEVASGKTIAEPLEKTGIFPPLLVQIVNLGERSGKLPELLNQAAGALEDRTETRVKVLTTILPPMLVVLVACVVGVVVAAILLPLLEMQDAASRM